MSEANERLVKLSFIAEILGVSARTVSRWVNDNKTDLPAYKIGRDLYFYRSEVEEWLEGCKIESNNHDSR